MLLLIWALVVTCAHSLHVDSGGPGNAVYIGYMQGLYIPSFPLPANEITVELWSRLLPVNQPTFLAFVFAVIFERFRVHVSRDWLLYCTIVGKMNATCAVGKSMAPKTAGRRRQLRVVFWSDRLWSCPSSSGFLVVTLIGDIDFH